MIGAASVQQFNFNDKIVMTKAFKSAAVARVNNWPIRWRPLAVSSVTGRHGAIKLFFHLISATHKRCQRAVPRAFNITLLSQVTAPARHVPISHPLNHVFTTGMRAYINYQHIYYRYINSRGSRGTTGPWPPHPNGPTIIALTLLIFAGNYWMKCNLTDLQSYL